MNRLMCFAATFFAILNRISNTSTIATAPKADINITAPLEKITMCYKPEFYAKNKCDSSPPAPLPIAERIALQVSIMPFNLHWIHIDVIPTPAAVAHSHTMKISYAMIQITDTADRFFGRVAEQIPCEKIGHSSYTKEITELYINPGVKNMEIIECPSDNTLSKNINPTIAVLRFQTPVEAFYVNFKFTKEEIDYLHDDTIDDRIFITTILVDAVGHCHLHRVVKLDGLPGTKMAGAEYPVVVPVQCDIVGPAFRDEAGNTSPLFMDHSYKPQFSQLNFVVNPEVRQRIQSAMSTVSKDLWRKAITQYNMKTHSVDSEGLLPGEKPVTRNRKVSAVRRPEVPLIFVGRAIEAIDSVQSPRKCKNLTVEKDDKECDSSWRHNKPKDLKNLMTRIYLKCGYMTGCFGRPVGCIEERNCDLVVSWGTHGKSGHVIFDVISDQRVYAAVGLSKDAAMGNDSVTECVREEDNKIYGYTSWNIHNPGEKRTNQRLRSCEPMKDFQGEFADGRRLYCTWQRPVVTTVKGVTFDLNKPLYLFIALGHVATHGLWGNIFEHEIKYIYPEPVVLNAAIGKTWHQYYAEKVHGSLMILLWLLVIPVATFNSRYMKGTFVNVRVMKKYTYWFGTHAILVIFSTAVTIIDALVQFGIDAHWKAGSGDDWLYSGHSILGFLICFMLLTQVAVAIVMLKNHIKFRIKKVPWNFIHGLLGHCMFFSAIACTYTARHVRDGMPCEASYPLTAYLVIYIIIHATMSYQICYTDFIEGREHSRVYKVFILDRPDVETEDESGSKGRQITFIIFVLNLTGFTLYFMITFLDEVSLDCIEEKIMLPGVTPTIGVLY